jgi:cytosine/adenosine deaminase-related metal-dependent hydrolase
MTHSSTRRAVLNGQIPEQGRTLIRGADLLTMDERSGEMNGADLLIDGQHIAAIGRGLTARGARIIDGRNTIVMPGMIDGHRHCWESVLIGELVATKRKGARDYLLFNNLAVGVCMSADDVYRGTLIGGTMLLDTGVTSVIAHEHVVHTAAKGDAAGRGLKDSGVGGVYCFGLSHTPSYGPGATVSAEKAMAEIFAPIDEAHLNWARQTRDRHFSDPNAPLKFGVGLSGLMFDGGRSIESMRWELEQARALQPALITWHGTRTAHLDAAGLLGPDMHMSHGNDLNEEELRRLAQIGVKLTPTPMGEYRYARPPIQARARAAGVSVGIGMDVPVAANPDYFEILRHAFWSIAKTPGAAALTRDYTSRKVLEFATSLGAKSLGQENLIGSLTVGKRADILMLRTDRCGFPTRGSLADRVVNFAKWEDLDSVWMAGVLRKQNRTMLGVDWQDLKRQAQALQQRVIPLAQSITFTFDASTPSTDV